MWMVSVVLLIKRCILANYVAYRVGLDSGLISVANTRLSPAVFDDVHRQSLEPIDCKYAFHLGGQANEQAKVTTGESNHCGNDLRCRT